MWWWLMCDSADSALFLQVRSVQGNHEDDPDAVMVLSGLLNSECKPSCLQITVLWVHGFYSKNVFECPQKKASNPEVISFIIKFKFDWINQLSVCICVKLQLCFSGVIYSCHGCHGDGNSSVRQFYKDFSRAPLMLLLLPQTQCLLSLSNWKQCCKKQKSGENSNLWTYLFKCGMNSR